MAKKSAKLGYGPAARIDTAVQSGVLDANDIVITEDTSEFIYLKDDGSQQVIRPRLRCFDTIVAATEALNASTDTYAGQQVMIKDSDGDYAIYIVQVNSLNQYEVTPLPTATGTGLEWVRF